MRGGVAAFAAGPGGMVSWKARQGRKDTYSRQFHSAMLNAYAVLDVLISLVRLGLALFVVVGGLLSLRRWRRRGEAQETGEQRGFLLMLSGCVLVILSVASWPLFYLMLQSYVPSWPSAMCIAGIRQIGADSVGPSRFLPGLVRTVEIMRPAMVFLAGAWLVLYLVNRRTTTAPLTRSVLVLLIAVGILGTADAAVEAAYLGIPKVEQTRAAGCCSAIASQVADGAGRVLPEVSQAGLTAAFYGAILAMCGTVAVYRHRWQRSSWPLLLGAAATTALGVAFMVDVAAPWLMRLPYHHCVYCLLANVPETIVAVGLLLAGSFAVGWCGVLWLLVRSGEARPFAEQLGRRLLAFGLWCYVAGVAMLSLELVLAR